MDASGSSGDKHFPCFNKFTVLETTLLWIFNKDERCDVPDIDVCKNFLVFAILVIHTLYHIPREKNLSHKTPTPSKSMNMNIWFADTSNQLVRGS